MLMDSLQLLRVCRTVHATCNQVWCARRGLCQKLHAHTCAKHHPSLCQ
jgi:hypothetical protein